jgi:glycosyltransferase involved in cell wall biosynthesis
VAANAIFTLCLRTFPGVDRLLVNLHRTTGLTRHLTVISPSPQSPEVQFAAEHIRERRPRLVIFGGWSPSYERILEALRDEPIDVAVYWASSPGQTDMSREMDKFSFVLSEPRVDHLLFATRPFADGLGRHRSAHYLPATLEVPASGATRRSQERATVTLFCSPPEYRRKNVLNCLLALAGARGSYRLLVNGLSEDSSYRSVLHALSLPYEEHGWMDRSDYETAVGQADLGLQVSFAESYCYVAAEHLIRGVPTLGSPMVPVFGRVSPELRDRLVVANPESVLEIREKIQYLLDRPRVREEIGRQAREELIAANARDVETARALLVRLTTTTG